MRGRARILSPILVLAMLFSAVAVLAPPRVTTVGASGGLEVICVPWQGDEGLPHPAYNGKEVTLKGVARYSGDVDFAWDFGDVTNVTGAVIATDEYPVPIEAKHTYTGPVGTEYVATLTVTATSGGDIGVSASDTYRVRILEETREVKADIAIDEGLWWLYKQQARYSDGGVDFGSWLAAASAGMYGVAHTAAAVEAFENNLHKPFGDPTKDPYVDCVRRGLNYLTSMMEVVTITDGDTNGNGIGISCYWAWDQEIYEAGMAMMAIVSSDTPGYEALAGPAGVIGRTLRDIVQDMADFLAFAQNDSGFHEGGWGYYRNYGESDNSCTQWPVLAMDSAEAKWGITIPGFVRTRLEGWLNRTQNANGAFGYQSEDDWLNIAKTAGTGITGLLFCGVPRADDRVQRAIEFVDTDWNNDNFGNGYAMYAVMKAFCVEFLNEEVIPGDGIDDHNWWQEYADALIPGGTWGQQADGRWNAMDWAQSDELTTAWMIMILARALYDVPPTAVARANGFGTTEVEAGQDVNFDGSQSTNGSYEIVLYEWDWESDGVYDYSSADPDPTHSYPSIGTYEVTLRVTDNRDVITNYQKPAMTATDSCTVWVHPPPHQPYWTVMVYMAADNDLIEAVPYNLMAIHAADYSPGVQVVFLLDGRGGGNSVIRAKTAEGIEAVDDEEAVIDPKTGEVNMGDPQTLVDFVTWAQAEYPAPNYALVLWDHGWRSPGGLCQDQTDNDSLTVRELGGALGAITSDGVNKLQVVGFDAGLMQMLEVDYQIREYAEYAVGSQGVGAVESWPYTEILTELALHPAKISAADLASLITQEYDAVYMGAEVLFPQGTMSAKDLSQIDELASLVDAFAGELLAMTEDELLGAVAAAADEAESFGEAFCGSIDLYHFAQLVATALPETDVATAAQAVMAAVGQAVIANSVGPDHPNAHGIAIYYPDVVAMGSDDGGGVLQFMFYDPSYDVDADFSTATRWAEYLKLAPRAVEEGILGLYIPDVLILAHVYEDPIIRLEWPAVSQDVADFTLAKPVDIIVTPEGAIDIGMVVLPYTQADLDDAGLLKTQLIGISGYDADAQAWELEKLTMDLPSWLFDLVGMFGGLGGVLDGGLGQDIPEELMAAFGSLAAAGQAVGDGGGGLPDYVGAVIAIPWLDLSNMAPDIYELMPDFPAVSSAETTSLAMIATNREDYLTPIQYPQNLYQGWNLVSLPVIPLDKDVETVLSGYDGLVEGVTDQVEVVWGYDAAAAEWYAYGPEAAEASELTVLKDGEGYWIKMSGDATMTVVGCNFLAGPHAPPQYDVVPGWNLIGYKGILPMPPQGDWRGGVYLAGYLDTAEYECLQGYDRVNDTLDTPDPLYPNDGYWVYATEPGSIPGLRDENWVKAVEYGCEDWVDTAASWIDYWMMQDGDLGLRLAWNAGWYRLWVIAPSI